MAVQHTCIHPKFLRVFYIYLYMYCIACFHSPVCQQGSVKFGQLTRQTRTSRPVFCSAQNPSGLQEAGKTTQKSDELSINLLQTLRYFSFTAETAPLHLQTDRGAGKSKQANKKKTSSKTLNGFSSMRCFAFVIHTKCM